MFIFCEYYSNAVSAYITCKQTLPFGFAGKKCKGYEDERQLWFYALLICFHYIYRAPDVIKQFESLDNAHNDYLDPMTVWDVLKETKTGDGEMLDDREVELFLKATLKEPGNDKVFLGDFVDLLARLHFYRKAKKAK